MALLIATVHTIALVNGISHEDLQSSSSFANLLLMTNKSLAEFEVWVESLDDYSASCSSIESHIEYMAEHHPETFLSDEERGHLINKLQDMQTHTSRWNIIRRWTLSGNLRFAWSV